MLYCPVVSGFFFVTALLCNTTYAVDEAVETKLFVLRGSLHDAGSFFNTHTGLGFLHALNAVPLSFFFLPKWLKPMHNFAVPFSLTYVFCHPCG